MWKLDDLQIENHDNDQICCSLKQRYCSILKKLLNRVVRGSSCSLQERDSGICLLLIQSYKS